MARKALFTGHDDTNNPNESLIVDRIRRGDQDAWSELVRTYESQLFAFAKSRLRNTAASEDVVQEVFLGFFHNLSNFDGRRSLEGYLFSICSHKIVDHVRREKRRSTVPLFSEESHDGSWEVSKHDRPADEILEAKEMVEAEQRMFDKVFKMQSKWWRRRGDGVKVKCAKLLVKGVANKSIARRLDVSEQYVANCKFGFVSRMNRAICGA